MGQRPAHDPRQPDPGLIVEILSHQLRTPITTIHLGTKVLNAADASIPPPVRREVVAAVEQEADRLYRLVEDLLAVARHEDGANPLPVRPLLLQHWLARVVDREASAAPGLRVRVFVPGDLPPVMADDAALEHVLRNLLANADHHAHDGMPVEVVAMPADGSSARLEIVDRGPGFDTLEAERLFDPFYRGPAAETAGRGAGLGLAAARRLARAMGGDLDAAPRDGGGARFSLVLATAEPDAA